MRRLREILALVKRTYCGTFALQYMHISDPAQSAWLKERIEGFGKEITFTRQGRRAILNKLVEAEGFEKFLQVKYTGTKRFGVDGGEALIPAMEQIIKRGGALGVEEIVIGMPHRGRLSVLANVLEKPYRAIFNEFQGGSFKPEEVEGSGDVKYHLGASSDREFDGNTVHLSLTANPSHLEAVDPVVLGKVRAKQAQRSDIERTKVLPILLHGDAAFAGQGVVAECFGLSGLKGHRTGGTIHVVVNNQIGFTTAPMYSRSSPYPTDLALMVEAPIFHVNGDDPEAVVHAARVATEFRQRFHRDVVIDMFCYRRFGHNEGDEPMFTQPLMYTAIKGHKTTLQLYTDRLVADGLIPEGEIEDMKAAFQAHLNAEFEAGQRVPPEQGRLARRPLVGDGQARGPLPAGQDRGRDGAAQEGRRGADPAARELPAAQDRAADARRQAGDDRDRRGPRLGHRRGARLRHAARRGLSGAPLGPGFDARHLQPAPLRHHRPGDRGALPAAQPHRARSGELRGRRTRCSRSTPCSATSTATASPSRTRWCSGRRSSATSSTARRS